MQFIHRSFDIRMVYIVVFMIAVLMLIQTLGSKGDDGEYQGVPNQDKVNQPSSSTSEGESKEYKEGDKED